MFKLQSLKLVDYLIVLEVYELDELTDHYDLVSIESNPLVFQEHCLYNFRHYKMYR